jgi:hypothetical protein
MTESDNEADFRTVECPISWCNHSERVENVDDKWDAGNTFRDHIATAHSEMDRETLRYEYTKRLLDS